MTARKIIALLAAFALTLTTACSNQSEVSEPQENQYIDTTSTLAASEPQESQFVDTTSTLAAETTETKSAETTAATSAAADTNAETTTQDYSQVSEFKYAPPIAEKPEEHVMAQYEKFDYEQYVSDDKEAEAIAIAAYKNSDYYKEALAQAREMLKYENGQLIQIKESWKTYYGGFEDFVTESPSHEVELEPIIWKKIKAKLDGENEENLFVATAAMPDSCLISTGTPACIVFGIYVNKMGQAFILDYSVYQGGIDFSTIKYTDLGKIHAVFNGWHTAGTARTAIYSFQNGEPKVEIYSWGNMCQFYEDGKLWTWGKSMYYSTYVFYDKDKERYYEIDPNIS